MQDFDELNLIVPRFVIDQFTSLSTGVNRREDGSVSYISHDSWSWPGVNRSEEDGPVSDISLDSWLQGLTENGTGESGESCSILPELMLSPHAVRAPLRSVLPDKRARMQV